MLIDQIILVKKNSKDKYKSRFVFNSSNFIEFMFFVNNLTEEDVKNIFSLDSNFNSIFNSNEDFNKKLYLEQIQLNSFPLKSKKKDLDCFLKSDNSIFLFDGNKCLFYSRNKDLDSEKKFKKYNVKNFCISYEFFNYLIKNKIDLEVDDGVLNNEFCNNFVLNFNEKYNKNISLNTLSNSLSAYLSNKNLFKNVSECFNFNEEEEFLFYDFVLLVHDNLVDFNLKEEKRLKNKM